MDVFIGISLGVLLWLGVRFVLLGFYTVDQNQRAVKTVFGHAQRIEDKSTLEDPIAQQLRAGER
jgi:regulator of protease activity HflC (stomatin/prohibitin superfamily)